MGTRSRGQYNYFKRCSTVGVMIVGKKNKIYLCTVSIMIMGGGGIIIYFGTVHERKEMRNGEDREKVNNYINRKGWV